MWQAAKPLSAGMAFFLLTGCASLFSAYDSEFSCKSSDHGGCEHPLTAYENARAGIAGTPVEASEDEEHHKHDGHVHAETDSAYESYQDAVYAALRELVREPDTPILAPAKVVRTLILPYTDPDGNSRLFMPRYVYSVLEGPRFVLGDYLLHKEADPGLQALLAAPSDKTGEGKE